MSTTSQPCRRSACQSRGSFGERLYSASESGRISELGAPRAMLDRPPDRFFGSKLRGGRLALCRVTWAIPVGVPAQRRRNAHRWLFDRPFCGLCEFARRHLQQRARRIAEILEGPTHGLTAPARPATLQCRFGASLPLAYRRIAMGRHGVTTDSRRSVRTCAQCVTAREPTRALRGALRQYCDEYKSAARERQRHGAKSEVQDKGPASGGVQVMDSILQNPCHSESL